MNSLWISGRRLAGLIWLAVLVVVITACGEDSNRSLEERAQQIDRALICPVCPAETIDQAQVEPARQMRAVVRAKLAQGWSRDQILQYFVDQYRDTLGEGILAEPPKKGFTLLAWVVPPSGIAAGALLLLLVVRAMRKGTRRAGREHPEDDGDLEPYLSAVDRELGISTKQAPMEETGE